MNREASFFDKVAATRFDYDIFPDEYYQQVFDLTLPELGNHNQLLLEYGCGSGAFGRRIVVQCPNYRMIGIDISFSMVRMASQKAFKNDLRGYYTAQADGYTLPFPNEAFDCVFCFFILHHFKNLEMPLAEVSRTVKPGGLICIVEPNGSNPIRFVSRLATRLPFFRHILNRTGLVSPDEVTHPITSYSKTMTHLGLKIKKICSSHIILASNKEALPWGLRLLVTSRDAMLNIAHCWLPWPYNSTNFLMIAEK